MDLSPVWVTLKIALASTVTVFITGLLLAWAVTRLGKAKSVMDSILSIPLVLPPTVVGFIVLIAFGSNSPVGKFLEMFGARLIFTWQGAALAAAIVSFPIMYRGARGAFEQLDQNVICAGRTLGLSEFKIFRRIMIPMAFPGIVASTVLAFARSLGEFGATLMVAGNLPGKTRTMSVAVYTAMQSSNRELAFKWVLIIIAYSLVILITLNLITERRARR